MQNSWFTIRIVKFIICIDIVDLNQNVGEENLAHIVYSVVKVRLTATHTALYRLPLFLHRQVY
jgi:hypothetical protein